MADRRSAADPATDAGIDETRLRAAERTENFPVAMRLLPARTRTHLRAVYDVVRAIDDIGDGDDSPDPTGTGPEDRSARLHTFAADLARVWDDAPGPREPVLRRLVGTVRDCGLAREPFDRLIAANLADQRVARYRTWDELLGYCTLSADPIGRLVLAVFDVDAPPGSAAERESDRICTALQLLEHWQDVAEDRARGRVYLPAEDLSAFGVTEADLAAAHASGPLRSLLAHETVRACALLDEGAPLLRRLHGWARLAVAGYLAGGRAAADSLRLAGFDVLAGSPRTRRRDVARHLVAELARAAR
jgi:squalene synthase HpnC